MCLCIKSISMATESKRPIDSPEQLRQLSASELKEVCGTLRHTLIEELSKNPGHFASSMGAVELTVALHYVYDTPYDRIVWDVGHQAYAHKLLTGRRERFATNRTLGGLCGFPTPNESEYDSFAAGHASNSISAALGMSIASKLNGDAPRRHVVAVIGDASISGGLAFEGLNNLAQSKEDVLVILNDNEMSIDHNVGALSRSLSRLNTSKRYNRVRYKIYRAMRRLGLVSEGVRGAVTRFNNSLKALLSRQQNMFEGLNIRYFGPIDGNDVEKVARVLADIKDMEGPKILHLRTRKGAGYMPAEEAPSLWHAPGRFDAATGQRLGGDKSEKWQDVFGKTILELAQRDRRVVGITAAMMSGTSMSVLHEAMPERVFDVGISEGHAVTFAGGMAKDGMRPFVAVYSSFLQRAYDQIFHDVALLGLPVTFCIDRAGLVGEDGATHHGALDIAYMRSIAGIAIAVPSSAGQLRQLMALSLEQDVPMAIRYPRGKAVEADCCSLSMGHGIKVKDGADVCLMSVGPLLGNVREAAGMLSDEGIDAAVYDMVFVRPLDSELMAEIAGKGLPIVTVEDGVRSGGFGSAVREWLDDHGYDHVTVKRLGLPDDAFVTHGTQAQLHKLCGLDPESIAQSVKELLRP